MVENPGKIHLAAGLGAVSPGVVPSRAPNPAPVDRLPRPPGVAESPPAPPRVLRVPHVLPVTGAAAVTAGVVEP